MAVFGLIQFVVLSKKTTNRTVVVMQERLNLDRPAAEEWVSRYVSVNGGIELVHDRPWSKVLRVPTERGDVWFKACAPIQRFEPRLTRELSSRWPSLVAEVLAYDESRSWMLMTDAGTSLGKQGNPPETWLRILPRYAELQVGETAYADDHLAHDVPDLRLVGLPQKFEGLVRHDDLPIDWTDAEQLQGLVPRFADMCGRLDRFEIPASIQHDDLHIANVYETEGRARILDWGDASVSHPCASLFVTFRFLEERNGLEPTDPWFAKLRDAYLEPWGSDLRGAFDLGLRVGAVAHAIAWLRQRDHLSTEARDEFDAGFVNILGRALRALLQDVELGAE
jgi:hypothetical protein